MPTSGGVRVELCSQSLRVAHRPMVRVTVMVVWWLD